MDHVYYPLIALINYIKNQLDKRRINKSRVSNYHGENKKCNFKSKNDLY